MIYGYKGDSDDKMDGYTGAAKRGQSMFSD